MLAASWILLTFGKKLHSVILRSCIFQNCTVSCTVKVLNSPLCPKINLSDLGLNWPILNFLTLLAPTAAAIAAGDTTEEARAGAGGFVVDIVDSGGHGKRLRRPRVSCSCFRARLRANLTNFTLFDASGTNGRRYRGGRHHWGGLGGRRWFCCKHRWFWRSWEEVEEASGELFVL